MKKNYTLKRDTDAGRNRPLSSSNPNESVVLVNHFPLNNQIIPLNYGRFFSTALQR
jgi:hypothetical protein